MYKLSFRRHPSEPLQLGQGRLYHIEKTNRSRRPDTPASRAWQHKLQVKQEPESAAKNKTTWLWHCTALARNSLVGLKEDEMSENVSGKIRLFGGASAGPCTFGECIEDLSCGDVNLTK